jgi:acetyl esterase/lipase
VSDFHPELRRAAFLIPRFSFGPRSARVANRLMRWRGVRVPPNVSGVAIRDELIVGSSGAPLRVRIYEPEGPAPRAAMLWMHGGGYVLGTVEQDEASNIGLCRSLNLVIAAVDYRLALEHPYPAPLEDCYSALRWLHESAASLNVSTNHIAVGGASAGAGLAAGLALLAHDRNELLVAFQLLIYPMLDDRTTLRSDSEERNLRLWSTASNRFGWRSYLGCEPGGDDVPDYAAPGRRQDMRGLPKAWIGVGTCDLFHDEDVEYARRLQHAGVPCVLEVVNGAFHGFELAGANLPVVRNFRENYASSLRNALDVERHGDPDGESIA